MLKLITAMLLLSTVACGPSQITLRDLRRQGRGPTSATQDVQNKRITMRLCGNVETLRADGTWALQWFATHHLGRAGENLGYGISHDPFGEGMLVGVSAAWEKMVNVRVQDMTHHVEGDCQVFRAKVTTLE